MANKSRATRWQEACDNANIALTELIDLQSEYQEWLDGLPEGGSDATREKLEAVCDIGLEDALDAIEEAEGTELPLGFGRD